MPLSLMDVFCGTKGVLLDSAENVVFETPFNHSATFNDTRTQGWNDQMRI